MISIGDLGKMALKSAGKDLPLRFTEAPDGRAREMGIFKHTRGVLRGWDLEPEEAARLEALGGAAEVVLLKRPRCLYVEVPTATEKLVRLGAAAELDFLDKEECAVEVAKNQTKAFVN